jgi:predicted nucleic acid-binding protein
VLLDTGPLIAMMTPNDQAHDACVAMAARILPPLLTCWPVLTEAAWLLRRDNQAVRSMLHGARRGEFSLLELSDGDLEHVERLMAKYNDLNPQLADVALLHLAQREGLDTVFTLDRRDFSVFRLRGNKRLRLLPEEE